ncbi:MAG: VCBS repeat-containing protein [Planctomycetes bacterium]|nr:VCBS repeat-containing protein [Planctomycetota bacterium]
MGVLGGLVLAATAQAQCDPSFAPPATFDTMTPVYFVAVDDFNGDCRPDVAAMTANDLVVTLGNGDGTLRAPVPYEFTGVNLGMYNVIAGGFTGPGRHDLAVAVDGPGVAILRGNPSDGTFQAPVYYPTTHPSRHVLSRDLNRDGHVDLVVTSDQDIEVLFGNEDGTFQSPISYPRTHGSKTAEMGQTTDGSDYVVLGSDGDGSLLETWVSDAQGTLQQVFAITNPINSLALADFDGDGILDLAATNTNLQIFLGNGDGTFRVFGDLIHICREVDCSSPRGIVAADFNEDGLVDLAVSSINYSDLAVLRGNGDGTFQPPAFIPAISGATFLAGADLDQDGRLDLIQGTQFYPNLRVLMNTGCGPLMPARGTVDMGVGGAGPVDTLLTNGASNAQNYVVDVSAATGGSLSIVEPPSRVGRGASYAVWMWVGWPCAGTEQVLPRGIGVTGMRTPIPPVQGTQPIRIANNTGHNQLGLEDWPGPTTRPAPYTLLTLPPGGPLSSRIGRRFYFQGVERDDRSAGTIGYSVTNGQQWLVVP